MKCYQEFPLSTVVYNLVTLGGALAAGVIIVVQFGFGATASYLALLALTGVGLLATVCARCSYYGRRCALGLGVVAPRAFKKGQEDEFFRTAPQFVVLLLLALLLFLPIAGGVVLLATEYSTGRLALLVALVGLLLAGLIPHPRLVCSHCCQGERGLCPIGRQLWKVECGEAVGHGLGYVKAVLDFGHRIFAPTAFRVTVAEFNKRVLRVWAKAGFRAVQAFQKEQDGRAFVVLMREV